MVEHPRLGRLLFTPPIRLYSHEFVVLSLFPVNKRSFHPRKSAIIENYRELSPFNFNTWIRTQRTTWELPTSDPFAARFHLPPAFRSTCEARNSASFHIIPLIFDGGEGFGPALSARSLLTDQTQKLASSGSHRNSRPAGVILSSNSEKLFNSTNSFILFRFNGERSPNDTDDGAVSPD
jgi:hypothetical protein